MVILLPQPLKYSDYKLEPHNLLKIYFYFCLLICVCGHECRCPETRRGWQSAWRLELQEVVSHHVWMLGTELKSSGTAVSAETIAPGPLPHNYFREKIKNKASRCDSLQYPSIRVAKAGELRFKASLGYMESSRMGNLKRSHLKKKIFKKAKITGHGGICL